MRELTDIFVDNKIITLSLCNKYKVNEMLFALNLKLLILFKLFKKELQSTWRK
jgi:hypothetical protein